MCASCAAKQQLAGYALNRTAKPKVSSPVECKYTFEQIGNKLVNLIEENKKFIHISYLRSALNLYSKNCNLFNKQLDEVFAS